MIEDQLKGFPPFLISLLGGSPLILGKIRICIGFLMGISLLVGVQGSSVRVPIVLTWNDNSKNEDGFRIERSTDNIEFVEIAVVGENVTHYPDSDSLVAGQTYAYRVRAFNEYGNSGYTNTRTTFYSPEPEFYFGELGSEGGVFAIMCRGDGSAIFVGAVESGSATTVVQEFQFGPEGVFSFEIVEWGVFTGQIVEGQLLGSVETATEGSGGLSIASAPLVLRGSAAQADGETASLAGFYDSGIDPETGARLLILAGPDGEAFVVSSIGSEVSGGEMEILPEAFGQAVLGDGSAITVDFAQMAGIVSGVVSKGGQDFEFVGLEEQTGGKSEFLNASMRSGIDRGATIVVGFVVSGMGEKRLLLRGIGPALAEMGVERPVWDPSLTLYQYGEQGALYENDDWAEEDEAFKRQLSSSVGAFPLDSSSKDAAIVVDVSAGVYWLHVKNNGYLAGTGLVEIYDLDGLNGVKTSSSLVNLSLRGTVEGVGDPIIAGFVVGGNDPKGVMVRAMGRELERFGVANPLHDPFLEVHGAGSSKGLIAENSNWQDDSSLLSQISGEVGAFAFQMGSLSAAKAMWLNAGLYTVVVNGLTPNLGEVLVELYEVP